MPAATLSSAVLVWAIASGSIVPAMRRLLASAPVRYIGDRSYSIYLWHYFIGVALLYGSESYGGPRRFALQVVVSLIVAFAAYESIEQPARLYLNRLIASTLRGDRQAASARVLSADD
jgi:peptidoglycan/LPS O-acetylase OafA/YrhL